MNQTAIHAAFHDAPREAQTVFRTVMEAMASPGRILPFQPGLEAPEPLLPTAAAVLLALADFETPVWLDSALTEARPVREFLRFHTGARMVDEPEAATFAAIAAPAAMPPLEAFAQGTLDYPDRSATLILQVETLHPDGWRLEGPGIRDAVRFNAAPLPADFTAQLAENRERFPLGVDLIFATRDAIAALPRSTRLTGEI
jgi:alpha-D-ribose 1-methylphosphonate 5-triphosphate synthase subunit PhnH